MKKKLLECDIHGKTLFRCKRKCCKSGGKRERSYSDEYSEKCFKCLGKKGRKKDAELMTPHKRHMYVKVE